MMMMTMMLGSSQTIKNALQRALNDSYFAMVQQRTFFTVVRMT